MKGESMFITNPLDPETKRRQALARVYALLVRLAEDKEQTAESNPRELQPERTKENEYQYRIET